MVVLRFQAAVNVMPSENGCLGVAWGGVLFRRKQGWSECRAFSPTLTLPAGGRGDGVRVGNAVSGCFLQTAVFLPFQAALMPSENPKSSLKTGLRASAGRKPKHQAICPSFGL
ncbi:hypothetical protein [Kingella potus]|uniref:hypothetical protein n=1 Tax=Kingella potus TaxID=265175 RepID=UPI001FD32316|nr:hypothetical protein [Kingella potus]UOP00675.1 hypothetical protein LVJ84_12865 [Kingella potus]